MNGIHKGSIGKEGCQSAAFSSPASSFFPQPAAFFPASSPPPTSRPFSQPAAFQPFFPTRSLFFQQVFPPGSQQPFFSTPPLPRVVKSGPGSDAGDAAWKNAAVAGGSPPLLPVDLAASAGHPPAIPSGVGLEDSPGGGDPSSWRSMGAREGVAGKKVRMGSASN